MTVYTDSEDEPSHKSPSIWFDVDGVTIGELLSNDYGTNLVTHVKGTAALQATDCRHQIADTRLADGGCDF